MLDEIQTFSLVPSHVKDVYLFYVLKREPMPSSVIVFVSTCEACERIHRMCKLLEIESVSLHSVVCDDDDDVTVSCLRKSV